jgi:PD-(D/E)XK nuclease superfamily
VMQLMTNSRLRAARACLRLHFFMYELGYRPIAESAALMFGTAAHAALEKRFLLLMDLLSAPSATFNLDPFEEMRLRVVLAGYDARWHDDAERYEVLDVERRFEAPLRRPVTLRRSTTWRIAGKVDAIVRERESGRVLVVEHKTASGDVGTGSLYWQRLRMDSQISIYLDGARAIGYDPAGVLYDVLGKPDIRPLKATPTEARKYTKTGALYANQREQDETPEEFGERCAAAIGENPDRYYQRAEMVRIGGELDAFREDLWDAALLISSKRHPRNPDACLRYGGACPYLPVCGGEASLTDPTRYRLTPIHPELEQEDPS